MTRPHQPSGPAVPIMSRRAARHRGARQEPMIRHLTPSHRAAACAPAALALVLALTAPAPAAFLRVPGDHASLADALGAAADGDTVAVAASHVVPGGVVAPGRPLVVLGGWSDDFSVRDGRTGVTAAVGAPSLTLAPPASGSPEVAGFAIASGDGQDLVAPLPGRYGGGVLVLGGDPVLRDLEITGGAVGTATQFGCGAGLALIDSDAEVEDVTVSGGQATWGGGVFIDGGNPQLTRVVARDNACGPDAAGRTAMGANVMVRMAGVPVATLTDCEVRGGRGAVDGGGLAWLGARGMTLVLDGCVIEDNTATRDGGGVYGNGGALVFTDCTLTGNGPVAGSDFLSGGGAYVTGARLSVAGGAFVGNSAAAGGGLTVNTGAEVDVRDVVFRANTAAQFGAALNYQSNQAGEITGNTMAGNAGPAGAGVLNIVNASPVLSGNLVSFNDGGGVAVSAGTVTPVCNDVHGNSGAAWSGLADPTGTGGNIDADPLFCDLAGGDLSVRSDSPCLDAPGCAPRIGALGAGCSVGVAAPEAAPGLAAGAFPNPANPAVTIRCRLPRDGRLRVTVHDVRGRLVRVLADEDAAAGVHDRRWDGRDTRGRAMPSGVYVYRLTSGSGDVAAGRVVLLR
jgi:hypothetical protein